MYGQAIDYYTAYWGYPPAQLALNNSEQQCFKEIRDTRCQHTVPGQYQAASKTPFEHRFAGGPLC